MIAGVGMVMTLYARWRRTDNPGDFWTKIGWQVLVIWLGLTALAITIQDHYRHLPPDHSCLSEFSEDGVRTTSRSLFARSCY